MCIDNAWDIGVACGECESCKTKAVEIVREFKDVLGTIKAWDLQSNIEIDEKKDEEIEKKDDKIEDLEEDIEKLKTSEESLEKTIKEKDKEIAALEKKLEDANKLILNQGSGDLDVEALKAHYNSLNSNCESLAEKLQLEIKNMEAQTEALKLKVEEMGDDIDFLNALKKAPCTTPRKKRTTKTKS